MADFLDAKVREIEQRLRELRPLIEEFHRLEAASAALEAVSGAGVAGVRRRRTPSTNGASATRRGRPRGGRGEN
ncbi:MAG TPA: hypothetical protein VFS37_08840, partial [Conexibacter sp.]|nr:hypothetical protein [Conexibacter sp.]